jgi:hypothetical protein
LLSPGHYNYTIPLPQCYVTRTLPLFSLLWLFSPVCFNRELLVSYQFRLWNIDIILRVRMFNFPKLLHPYKLVQLLDKYETLEFFLQINLLNKKRINLWFFFSGQRTEQNIGNNMNVTENITIVYTKNIWKHES